MKMSKFATTTLAAVVTTLALSSVAFADTADITNTGPGSSNQVTIDNTNHTDISNDNNVVVNNTNTQVASSDGATVSDNTTGGSAITGAASNTNSSITTVSIGNQPGSTPDGGQGGGGQGGGGQGGGTSNLGSSGFGAAGSGSLALGTATLPETGPGQPMDVSALRNLLSHAAGQVDQIARPKPATSVAFTILSLLVSLMGAIGAAKFTARRTLRV